MENTKPICPLCHEEVKTPGDTIYLGDMLLEPIDILLSEAKRLVDQKSAELAVAEQIRRNCETIGALVRVII